MSQAKQDKRVDYLEFAAKDLAAIKAFYGEVFGWEFTDYGPSYTSFFDGRVAGGFTTDTPVTGSDMLVVIYAVDLEAVKTKVSACGGKIVRETFEFPGGKRFHFTDPSGNQLAVWSDQ